MRILAGSQDHRGEGWANRVLRIMLGAGLLILLLPACQHEPLSPVDPGPIDTTGNPIDTMPVDTMGVPCDPEVVYFEQDILPLLRSNCAKSGCHDAITAEEDIILDSYDNVMGADIIRPFDPNSSDLYEVITEDDPDKIMPRPPNQPLNAEQIALIRKWIQQGAKDLTCDADAGECNTANVTYAGFVAPLLAKYCVGCHSGPAASANIQLNIFAGVREVALNGRLVGAITWAQGFQPMPRGSAQLPACDIDKIKAWINDGALDN